MSMQEPTVETEETMEDATDAEVVIDAEALAQAESDLDAMLGETQEVDADVTNFTAPMSGIEHGHGLTVEEAEGMHDLRARFNVSEDFIGDNFYTMPNDHLALFELSYRKDEFQNADDAVFTDVPNDDSQRWSKIESFVQSNRAPVPDHARQKLKHAIDN